MHVPDDYEKNFKQAEETFLYQLVFDPVSMNLVPLSDLPDGLKPGDLGFAGPYPWQTAVTNAILTKFKVKLIWNLPFFQLYFSSLFFSIYFSCPFFAQD